MKHLYTYTFSDGHTCTSYLGAKELSTRMQRLDWLRVLTEGYTEGEGYSICQKAIRAYNKRDNFTGIIRLTLTEKDFLGYMAADPMNDDPMDKEVFWYYLRY